MNAARRDLADIRLAGQWFAPHYAIPESWTCHTSGPLLSSPAPHAEDLGEIAAGERFAALEVSGDFAWGYRERDSRVGYVAVHILTQDAA